MYLDLHSSVQLEVKAHDASLSIFLSQLNVYDEYPARVIVASSNINSVSKGVSLSCFLYGFVLVIHGLSWSPPPSVCQDALFLPPPYPEINSILSYAKFSRNVDTVFLLTKYFFSVQFNYRVL